MKQLVVRDDRGTVAVLTMNQPEKLNAFSLAVADEISAHLAAIADDPTVGACVLTGAGDRAFCAGTDLKDPGTHAVGDLDEHLRTLDHNSAADFFRNLLGFRKPLICAVRGWAIGIGFQLQLCSDAIICNPEARFRLPQVTLGVMPAYGGAPRLAQWVGRGRAHEIALSGRDVTGEEAYRIGLANHIHPTDEVLDRAVELGERMAANSELSMALTKESLAYALEEGQLRTAAASDNYRFMALTGTTVATGRHADWRASKADANKKSTTSNGAER